MSKKKVIILGKLPPPLMGPALATQIILSSRLAKEYDLIHIKTNINDSVSSMGRFSLKKSFKNIGLYFKVFGKSIGSGADLVLIPISQTTMGFIKDAGYIWLAWLTGRKVLLQLRGSNWKNWLGSSNGLVRWYVKLTCRRAKGVIVLGNNLKYLFDDIYRAEQIHVIPNGGNYDIPNPKSPDKPQVLYLANYLPTKGFDVFLESLIGIDVPYEVNSYGAWDNPDFKAKCESIVKENNLPVIINGPISGQEKMQAFSDADIFVFTPQHPEGHPWVTIEALASSLPVIATDQGAIIETIRDQKNGFIVPKAGVKETKKCLTLLITDQDLRKRMGEESRSIYLSMLTEEHMIENLDNTFKKVIG